MESQVAVLVVAPEGVERLQVLYRNFASGPVFLRLQVEADQILKAVWSEIAGLSWEREQVLVLVVLEKDLVLPVLERK